MKPGNLRLFTMSAVLLSASSLLFAQAGKKEFREILRKVADAPYTCEYLIIDEIPGVSTDTFIFNTGCGDSLFWNIVKTKDKGIMPLISLLDCRELSAAPVPYCGNNYTVGVLAYMALSEIINGLPSISESLPPGSEEEGTAWCGCLQVMRQDPAKVKIFKKTIARWYRKNRKELVWVYSDSFSTLDACSFNHPNKGHYEIPGRNK